jgi:hypothetical protein
MSTNGAILIDGTAIENVLAWLYQSYPDHQPRPLLLDTPYEALMEIGPILLDAPQAVRSSVIGPPGWQA